MEKIQVSYEDSLELERLSYEINAHQNILMYMIQNNLINFNNFHKIHDEYLQFYKKFIILRQEIEQKYIISEEKKFISWKLDFETQTLIIYN